MKKVEVYNAAIAVAQDQLDNTNPAAFDARVGGKAVELNLNANDYNLFSQHARQARGTLLQLQQQDEQAAAQAAKLAANKPNPATGQ